MPKQYRPDLFSNFTPYISKLPDLDFELNSEPMTCARFSRHWLPYLVGALELFNGGHVFDVSEARKKEISGMFEELIVELSINACAASDCVGQCVNFYYPSDDFEVSPGIVNGGGFSPPAGYAVNPWVTGETISIPGVELFPSDLLTTIVQLGNALSFGALEALLVSGFPRIRYHFTSKPGTVEITLLQVPQGGRCLIRLDDELSLDTVDLSSVSFGDILDWESIIFALLGLTDGGITNVVVPELIVEKEIRTSGNHTLDILMLPNIDFPGILTSGWGGGCKKNQDLRSR